MNQPTKCKHCRLHATWHIYEDTFFACGTIYAGIGDYWNQSTGCVEIMQSRERIKRAVEVLEKAERHEMVIDQNGDIDWVDIPEGTMMLSAPANEATAILKGKEDDEAE